MLIKPLTSYEFSESIVKVGDLFCRTDYYDKTYAVTGISQLTWKVGKKKKVTKCEHKIELFSFADGQSLHLDTFVFRNFYLNSKTCKKIWSVDVSNKRNDYVD